MSSELPALDPLALLVARRKDVEPLRGRPHFWPLIFLMLVLLSVAVTVMKKPVTVDGEGVPTPTEVAQRESRVYTVSYRAGVFSPTNLRIHVGDTVRWHNESALPVRVVAQLQEGQRIPDFDSVGTIPSDGYFSFTFSRVSTYGYYNPASAQETGVIIVR